MPLITIEKKEKKAKTFKAIYNVPKDNYKKKQLDFALSLESIASRINEIDEENVLFDLEYGKKLLLDIARTSLESKKSSKFVNRIRFNLESIETKASLQKYMYNMILSGHNLRIK